MGSCEAARDELDRGDQEPCLGAFDGAFEVLGETAVAPEPCEGSLDDPALGLGLEGADLLGAGHDLDGPSAECRDRVAQPFAAIDAVGEDMPQPGEALPQRTKQ